MATLYEYICRPGLVTDRRHRSRPERSAYAYVELAIPRALRGSLLDFGSQKATVVAGVPLTAAAVEYHGPWLATVAASVQ